METFTRSRRAIVTMAFTYVLALVTGVVMAHAGSMFALRMRDRVVLRAQSSAIIKAYRDGNRVRAAGLDFAENVCLGGIPSTIVGALFPAGIYPIAIYRGWIGGVVSVDRHHASRLSRSSDAIYYVLAALLQLSGYSLVGGAGLIPGRARAGGTARRLTDWSRIPRWAWNDALRIYAVAMPLFLIGSLYEFLAR
jgi:hypothetical protein